MAINITNSGATIKIDITVAYQAPGVTYPVGITFMSKQDLVIKSKDDNVLITDERTSFIFKYSDVTTPAGADAAAVAALIEAFLDTAGGVTSTLLPSENHIGQVGGTTVKRSNDITTTNGTAYASGDNIGGINTLQSAVRVAGGSGFISDIVIWDKDDEKAPLIIDFWDASPSGTYTNDAPQVIAGDEAAHLGSVAIAAGDYVTTGAIARVNLKGVNIPIKANDAALDPTDIFFTIVTTGTPTYTSELGLIVKHGIIQD